MFGAYRCYLALVVALFHIHTLTLRMAGPVAVFGFYVLSGLMISRVIDRTYGDGLRGFVGFIANRALRLYPAYWLFALMSLAIYLSFRWARPPVIFSTGIVDVLANISMVGLLGRPSFIIPPAWSLSIEITYYVAMAALLARGRRLVTLWWMASLGYSAFLIYQGKWQAVYFSYLGPTICFSSGAMLYHYGPWLRPGVRWLRFWVVPLSMALPFSWFLAEAGWLPFAIDRIALLYTTVVVMSLAALRLDTAPPKEPGSRLASIDRFLGDLSYPVFVSHYAIVFVVTRVLFAQRPSWGLAAAIVIPTVLLLSAAAVLFVERPLQRYRTRVRNWTHQPRATQPSGR